MEINTDAADAFMAGKRFKRSNTQVIVTRTGVLMTLHGHEIAFRTSNGSLYVSLAGWPTVTTRARLNAIPGVRINQKDHVQYLNGQEMHPHIWHKVK